MSFYSNIVRIQSESSYGTGIILSDNRILTAAHVIKDSGKVTIRLAGHTYECHIINGNEYVTLLETDNHDLPELQDKVYFTDEEILDNKSNYVVQGFRTSEQVEFTIQGTGLVRKQNEDDSSDFILTGISEGISNNYKGLSGSPVICNERAVGIIQIYSWDIAGRLGIGFTSIELINDILSESDIKESKYISEIRRACSEKCAKEIEKNKKSTKYIPEIYVEEGDYKEKLRYFADPDLFTKKTLEELNSFDYTAYDNMAKKMKKAPIDFSRFDPEQGRNALIKELERAISLMEAAEKNILQSGEAMENYFKQRSVINSSLRFELQDAIEMLRYTEYQAIVLTKNAGQGKTNFLCDFTENFLMRRKQISLYFNAYEFTEKPSGAVWNILTLNGKIQREYVRDALEKYYQLTHKAVVVVIDGLNENSTLNDFGQYMFQSLSEFNQLSFIKVIMTSRSEYFYDRFPQLTKDDLGNEFICEKMVSGDDQFRDRIFNGYLKHFNISIDSHISKNRAFSMLSGDTLLLRIFCEVNRGVHGLPFYDVYRYSLFEAYYNRKRKEAAQKGPSESGQIFDQLIEHIIEYMIYNGIFSDIPCSILQSDELDMLDRLLETDILLCSDVLVKKGLVEDNERVVSFTFDEFREYCITRYLIRSGDKTFVSIWNKMHEEGWSVCEGVERYAFCLGRTSVKGILPLLRKDKNYPRIYWENIFSLKDEDLTEEDIVIWKNEFKNEKSHRCRLVRYLLEHKTKDFKKSSINLFYEILDEESSDPAKYIELIEMLFPHSKKDNYGNAITNLDYVFEYDKVADIIIERLEKDENADFRYCLKLFVYIYNIDINLMRNLWIKAYEFKQDLTLQILEEFANRKSLTTIVRMNIEGILENIQSVADDNRIKDISNMISAGTDYSDIISRLNAIWS